MIHIEQNQEIKENDQLRVLSVSGDYSDNDLIEYQDISNPGISTGVFQAQFIKYGSLVYRFSEPEELGQALVELDTECTHDAAILYKEAEARKLKRVVGDMTPDNPVPVDETISQVAQDEAILEESIPANTLSESTNSNEVIQELPVTPEVANDLPTTDKATDTIPVADQVTSDVVSNLETINNNVSEIIDVANKSQEIIDALTAAPIN